tara:strand:- start:43 stop:2157 length:2115 start_codon:yes stop_codon:yes gene_type:complete
MGFIGKNRGKAIKSGGGGGSFSRSDISWLGLNRTLVADPGLASSGHEASGGVISEYTDPGPGDVYRAHIFNSSGTFDVTAVDTGIANSEVDIMAIAGGGGGGNAANPGHSGNGGGGAGGMFVVTTYPIAINPYTITIGGGGSSISGRKTSSGTDGSYRRGSDTTIADPTGTLLTAKGGGAGGNASQPSPLSAPGAWAPAGTPGGCSGGNGGWPGSDNTQPASTQPTQNPGVSNLTNYAGRGGLGTDMDGYGDSGGGGGGTGGDGGDYSPSGTQNGGVGTNNNYSTGSNISYGGGGAGSSGHGMPAGNGSASDGGGDVGTPTQSGAAAVNRGGGGGAFGAYTTTDVQLNGGSGYCVIRYKIASLESTARATGGLVSFYNGKTIHQFNSSGTFATQPNWAATTVEYCVVGGGGAGGNYQYRGGGGGAGAMVTGTLPIGAHPQSITATVGAGGVAADPTSTGNDLRGTSSTFGPTITALYGGGGGGWASEAGSTGGSGGGAGGNPGNTGYAGSGDPYPGSGLASSPPNGWGNDGATASAPTSIAQGCGGGGAGADGNTNQPYPDNSTGLGGMGLQVPSTFRNPKSNIGTNCPAPLLPAPFSSECDTGYGWLAGGGNAGGYPPEVNPYIGSTVPVGGGGLGGYRGPGTPGPEYAPVPYGPSTGYEEGYPAQVNTGSGGGGSSASPQEGQRMNTSGKGGSGIILVAYPS